MKTNRGLFILFTTSLLTLAGCGSTSSGGGELTKYQKVAKAFTAVAKTLTLKSSNRNEKRISRAVDIHGDMSNFESYFANAQTDEKIEDQIDLNTPPLMQFQYLKVIYETIGSSYSFDTKYSHTITGDIYIDFETGYKDKEQSDANKYSFAFDLSIYINIDENDLITSEVGMDITLSQGQKSYKYYKYALLVLDYDFELKDDNYELALYDLGQNNDLKYLECDYGYEYDYCLVSHGKLSEWRKFRYESDRKMFKDASHPTLDSYINEGAEITTSNQRWYKNNVIRRLDSNTPGALAVAKESYRAFGLNNTDLDSDGFFAKESIDSRAIQTIYDRSSREYGDELIYHIIAEEEDNEPEDNGWPNQNIEQITGINTFVFSNRDGVTYESYRNDVDGESASIVITVKGANVSEYQQFERVIQDDYGYTQMEDQNGFHVFTLTLIDNTILSILVSQSTNTIVFMHYFGGQSQNPYEPIILENMITYEYPYNVCYINNFSVEKEIFDVLSRAFNDQSVNKVFTNKISISESKKLDIAVSEKEMEYLDNPKTVKDARDMLMSKYEGDYYQQWKGTNYERVHSNNNGKDIVYFEADEQDNVFHVYFFRCIDDTMSKYLDGSLARYVDVEIYMHPHNGDVYLWDTISVEEGQSVFTVLYFGDVNYYFDSDMTILVTEENSQAYKGMVLHRRDYEDPVYDKISVPGGIDYEYPYGWYNAFTIDSDEGIYNLAINSVGDSEIRAYLEGKVSMSEAANNKRYEIYIGPEEARYMGMSEVEAAKKIYAQYTGEYKSWNKGTKGNYFYTGDKEEDIIFFDQGQLNEGHIIFTHIHLTSKVMANYESGSGSGGQTPTTATVIVFQYENGRYKDTATINCPVGADVRPYLNDFEGQAYLDGNFDTPLNDSNCAATETMFIYINNVTGSQETTTTIYVFSIGEDGVVNTSEVTAVVGSDLFEAVSGYGDVYLDAEYKQKINKGEYTVTVDQVVYVKPNQGGGEIRTGVVTVYVYENGVQVNEHVFSATIGSDVRDSLGGYEEGTRYIDASFSVELDDTNCAVYDKMNIYIVKNSTPQITDIIIPVTIFSKSGEKLSNYTITCKVGEDVRTYFRGYEGDIFLDAEFTIQLTTKNCYAYEGMAIYIVLRNK